MLEVLFGESEACAMKVAKSNAGAGKAVDGPTAVLGRCPARNVRKEWKPVPGTSDEVFCFSYLLDVGNIQLPFDSDYRRDLLLKMYLQSGWEDSREYIQGLREGIDAAFEEYDRFLQEIQKGAPVRIWYSDAPYSLCGLYWLCSQLQDGENEIYAVEMPVDQEDTEASVILERKNWGEVPAEEFGDFLCLQKKISRNRCRMYGQKWKALTADNSPLRAFVNGRLTGVAEDFYDYWIWKTLGSQPMKAGRLIGNLLLNYPVGVSDCWYLYRIEKLIQEKKIRVYQEAPSKFQQVICAEALPEVPGPVQF